MWNPSESGSANPFYTPHPWFMALFPAPLPHLCTVVPDSSSLVSPVTFLPISLFLLSVCYSPLNAQAKLHPLRETFPDFFGAELSLVWASKGFVLTFPM